jgi:NADH-quinone oxidoreductase subunit L
VIDYLWILIALPIVGAVTLVLFGKRIGAPAAGWLASTVVVADFVFAAALTADFFGGGGEIETVFLFSWIPILGVDASLLWDPLAATMTLVVTGVGALIHIYAIGYMRGDDRFPRFFAYMNLFIASMLTLVLADNFAVMFVGWELVGLSSYLLISFWFTKPAAAAAGKKAFIVNRIGDWGFLVALMLIFAAFGTFDFATVFEEAPTVLTVGMATAITLLLFVGAIGKSAQIPLYVWLPDAMEGPTPVSALIHAATMVTAGVYMIARTAALFQLAPTTGAIVATVGAVTALYAATLAAGQRDIKRVLAYSTISQLGYMILAVGVGAYIAGIFHLVTHAFFKALLFLAAGSVIHALAGEQDMWKMGGLRKVMKITFGASVVGWLAISGVVPFAGFWSKDEVLGAVFDKGGLYYLLWLIGVVTALFTSWYMTRWLVLTFLKDPRWDDGVHPHESPPSMTIPLIVLAAATAIGGFLNTPWRLGLEHFLEPSFELVALPHLPSAVTLWFLTVGTLFVVFAGIVLAWLRYGRGSLPVERGGFWADAVRGYGVDDFYGKVIVEPGKAIAIWSATVLDTKIIDGVVNGVGRATKTMGDALRPLQSGLVRSYALMIFAGTVGLIVLLLARGGGF